MSSRSRHDVVYDFLAPAFLILTPFVSFAMYNRYGYAAPELWICLAGLLAVALLFGLAGAIGGWPVRAVLTAGLLLLFVDLQFRWFNKANTGRELHVLAVFLLALVLSWVMRRHLSRIVTAVFATMLVSTVVLGSVRDVAPPGQPAGAVDDPIPRLPGAPIFVHLILDEYIGIEGIPADVPHGREMRTFVRNFFESYGFRLFGRSYSRYANTYNAIPNILNFSSEQDDAALTSGAAPYVLIKNEYFERMDLAGYEINVYGFGYLDLCKMAHDDIVRCHDDSNTDVNSVEWLDVSLTEKVTLIYHLYARRSDLQVAMGAYYDSIREGVRSLGWTLPEWWFEDVRLGPIPSMPVFDSVTSDVARSSGGEMFYVHVGNPHFPYVYDSMCNLYHPTKWERPVNPFPMEANNRQSRAERYGRYLEQVRCLHRKLDVMFQTWEEAGIFDRLVIVVHGDHGSKICRLRAVARNAQQLSPADYVDTFSTLFAVKDPSVPAGYDRRIASVQELLEEVVARQTGSPHAYVDPIPYVFLSDGGGKPMLRQPLPVFGDGQ